jgi:hypothetical protein
MSKINKESLMFSEDIDDRLAIEYLYEDFNNIWHGSWAEFIEAIYDTIKGSVNNFL